MVFGVFWRFECSNEIPSISSVAECRIWAVRVVGFSFQVFLRIWGPKVVNLWNFAFGLILVSIQDSNARIRIPRVPLDLGDDFRPRWVLGWFLRGSELVLAFLAWVSFLWFSRMSGQEDLKFVFWWFHWVQNIEYNWLAYVVCVCGVSHESWGSFRWFETWVAFFWLVEYFNYSKLFILRHLS